MSEDKKKMSILFGLAEVFNYKFSDAVFSIYMKVLETLPAEELNEVVSEGLKTNRWQFFPKPGEFFTSGETAILDDARDSAHLAWSCISRFGRHNPTQASQTMGDLAWHVINRMGGWSEACNINTSDKGIWIAQFRDLAQSMSRKSEKGDLERKPSLPPSFDKKRLEHLKSLTSKIGGPTDGEG